MKTFLCLILVSLFLFSGCVRTDTPSPPSGGLVGEANEYCSQFTESTCSGSEYVTQDYAEPINCYWSSTRNVCEAGIGYQ